MLKVREIDVFRAENQVLRRVSLSVEQGETVALIGANGAGKSTLIETLVGFLHPIQGSIEIDGQEVTRLEAHAIAQERVAYVPEGRRLFSDMTVLENLEMGAYLPSARTRFSENLDSVYSLFPVLKNRASQIAGTLSGGEQQMLSIGRALMLGPKLLLLDEMSLGLSPKFTETVFRAVQTIKQAGLSILIVEQNAALALENSDRGYVLENGAIVREGSAYALLNDATIRSSYLGI